MSRKEKIDKLMSEVNRIENIDRLWEIAKDLSELYAWDDYSNTVKRILEIEDRKDLK